MIVLTVALAALVGLSLGLLGGGGALLAATLAGEGFLVAMPEVYHEHEAAGTVLAYDAPGTDRGNALKFLKPASGHDSDAQALFDWLEGHPSCTGALGTFGNIGGNGQHDRT